MAHNVFLINSILRVIIFSALRKGNEIRMDVSVTDNKDFERRRQEQEDVLREIEEEFLKSPKPFDSMGHVVSHLDADELSSLLRQSHFYAGARYDILKMLKTEVPFTVVKMAVLGRVRCFCCGQEISLYYDGKKFFLESPCPYPEGIPLAVELNIPSGVMMIRDDLREDFEIPCMPEKYGDFYSANYHIGAVRTSLLASEFGCAHFMVGGGFPRVYRQDSRNLIVVKNGYNEEDDREVCPEGDLVATVDTRLWWYSVVDKDEYLRRGCEGKYDGIQEIKVEPGVYRFTHLVHLRSFAREKDRPTVFSRIEWVRPPDPPKDYGVILEKARELAADLGLNKKK